MHAAAAARARLFLFVETHVRQAEILRRQVGDDPRLFVVIEQRVLAVFAPLHSHVVATAANSAPTSAPDLPLKVDDRAECHDTCRVWRKNAEVQRRQPLRRMQRHAGYAVVHESQAGAECIHLLAAAPLSGMAFRAGFVRQRWGGKTAEAVGHRGVLCVGREPEAHLVVRNCVGETALGARMRRSACCGETFGAVRHAKEEVVCVLLMRAFRVEAAQALQRRPYSFGLHTGHVLHGQVGFYKLMIDHVWHKLRVQQLLENRTHVAAAADVAQSEVAGVVRMLLCSLCHRPLSHSCEALADCRLWRGFCNLRLLRRLRLVGLLARLLLAAWLRHVAPAPASCRNGRPRPLKAYAGASASLHPPRVTQAVLSHRGHHPRRLSPPPYMFEIGLRIRRNF